jgi:hypothetical protein
MTSPRLWHEQRNGQNRYSSGCRKNEKTSLIARFRGNIPRRDAAQRGSEGGCESENADAKIEPIGSMRDIGCDQRLKHAEHCAADAIEKLQADNPVGAARQGKQARVQRYGGKAHQKHRPASPFVGLAGQKGRDRCDHGLRNDKATSKNDIAPCIADAVGKSLHGQRQNIAVRAVEKNYTYDKC